MFAVSAGELVAQLGGELLGDGATLVRCIAPLETAGADSISFLSNPRFQAQLAGSNAGCVIVSPQMRDLAGARPSAIVSADPYLYFARLTQWWKHRTRAGHESADCREVAAAIRVVPNAGYPVQQSK